MYAVAFAPCAGRDQWGFTYVCPWCGQGHFGRAKTEADVAGPRRSRCGRLVVIRAAGEDLDEAILRAFSDGWRHGLVAGAERGNAA